MNFSKAKDALLVALISLVCTYMGTKVGQATDSIVELNSSVKILIDRSETHKVRLERLEGAIFRPGLVHD